MYCSPPPAKTTLLQYYCTTIAQYTHTHRPLLFTPYTIYNCLRQYCVKAKLRGTIPVGSAAAEYRSMSRVVSFVCWPLHDIVITNIVWCMAYKGRVAGRSYIAQKSRNSIAVVWVMQMGGGNKGILDSGTHKNK